MQGSLRLGVTRRWKTYVKRKTPSAGEAMVADVKHIPARVNGWIAGADSRETDSWYWT